MVINWKLMNCLIDIRWGFRIYFTDRRPLQENSCIVFGVKAMKLGHTEVRVTYEYGGISLHAMVVIAAYKPLRVSIFLCYKFCSPLCKIPQTIRINCMLYTVHISSRFQGIILYLDSRKKNWNGKVAIVLGEQFIRLEIARIALF